MAIPPSNSNEEGMADRTNAVIQKFAGLRTPDGATRRVDYKGMRARLNLRVAAGMSADLQIIKLVTGEAKNEFCDRILKEAINAKLKELRAHHDDAAWQTIETCAAAARK